MRPVEGEEEGEKARTHGELAVQGHGIGFTGVERVAEVERVFPFVFFYYFCLF